MYMLERCRGRVRHVVIVKARFIGVLFVKDCYKTRVYVQYVLETELE